MMKLMKKSMLVLSVMTLIGGMSFAATAKKRTGKKPAARKVASESYTCGSERITVSYPATNAARVVTKAGKVYNLKVAVSGSGSRYVSKNGNIEFFKGGKDAIYRGPNGIEKSCTRR